MINETALGRMIGNVGSPEMKKILSAIATAKIQSQIICNSKKCKGKVIGFILANGKPQEKMTKKSGLLSIRQRMDGYIGCECLCGNDSRIAMQEKGIIDKTYTNKRIMGTTPSREDLMKVANNLEKIKPNYKKVNGSIEIDGFTIEDFRG